MERSVATESIKSGSSAALCSEATIEIKIKAPDSQTYTMRVDNCMPVNALMDQLTPITGILREEQRLICGGRRMQDHHLLSHYHLEDGQTLHLVVRQPEFYNISPVLKISERMDPLSLAKVVASRGVNGSKMGGVTRRVGGDGSSLAPPKKKARSGTRLRDKVSSGPSKNISAGVVTEEINNAFTSNVVETYPSSKSKGKGVVEEVAADVVVVHSGTTKDKGKDVAVGKRLSMLLKDLKNAERSVNEIANANDEIEKEKKALIEEVDNLRNAKSALEAELSQNKKDLVSANSVKDFLSAKLDKVKEDAKKKSEDDAAEIKRMKFANTMYRDHVCNDNMYRDHVYKFVNSESCKTYVTHKCATSFSIGYETCGKYVGEGNVFETSKNGLDPFLKWVNDNPEAVKELLADPEPEVWNPTLEIPVDEVMRLDGTTSDSEDDDEVEEDAEDNAEAGTGTSVQK